MISIYRRLIEVALMHETQTIRRQALLKELWRLDQRHQATHVITEPRKESVWRGLGQPVSDLPSE